MSENIPIFEFKKITCVYEGGPLVKALDSISFRIYEGDTFGIVGDKGSGKSTLVKMFTCLEKSTFGSVRYRGMEVAEMAPAQLKGLRRKCATILHPHGLVEARSVRENLELAGKLAGLTEQELSGRIGEIRDICGITEVIEKTAGCLNPCMKLLTAIARAMMSLPECLILDETDKELNRNELELVTDILKKLREKYSLTLIVVTNIMQMVESLCNHAIVLEEGHLVECGSVLDIIRSPRSAAAKKLVYPENTPLEQYDSQGKRCVRIAFDGTAAREPVIAGLVEETGEKVSILCANTKSIGGEGFGQMIVELPDERIAAQKVINYFKNKGVFSEVIK